jgi:hypothetical protein
MKASILKPLIALALLALLSTINSQVATVFAQGTTAFTYQGQLRDNGTNANGNYTMVFNLYDAATSGDLIGGPITTSPTLVNGLFSVNLDFGASAFNGSARWLDITITNGGVTQELSPRVQVLPSPYALYAAVAATVTNGAITSAQIANGAVVNQNLTANAVNSTNIAGGQVVKSLNGLTDAVLLSAGTNVVLATNGNTLQISASGGGGVTVTNTLAAGNNVGLFANSGVVQISSFVPNVQAFFNENGTNGTFIVPTNVTRIMVEMWGAGGGGGAGYNTGSSGNIGGGGGGGAYAWSILTVTPGSSFSVTAAGKSNGGQAGGTSSFTGNGVSMSAGGGSPGGNATSSRNGTGGIGGTGSGSLWNVQGDGGDSYGDGGGVWRGGEIQMQSSAGGGVNGPGSGGIGGGPGSGGVASQGGGGNGGPVLVYY